MPISVEISRAGLTVSMDEIYFQSDIASQPMKPNQFDIRRRCTSLPLADCSPPQLLRMKMNE